jgi:hypothetical protein
MLEFIDIADDVIALNISGRITRDDLDPIMDSLDAAMAKHERVHVFVETRSISSLEIAALPTYAARAFPLFGKLNRFGRVAVVADQAWVRVGTQIESAILPFISYRTFEPDERERALRWVTTGED